MAINNCQAASENQKIKYVKDNAPITKSFLNKTIDKLDSKIKVVGDFFGEKVFSKLNFNGKKIKSNISNSNFSTDENGRLQGSSETENIVIDVYSKKQENDADEHKGFLRNMLDKMSGLTRPFSKVSSNRYVVQNALVTQRESYNIAFDSIVKKLNFLYNKNGTVSMDTLQKMTQVMLSGTVIDNYVNDMALPMQDDFFTEAETNPNVDVEQLMEDVKNSDEFKQYIESVEKDIAQFEGAIENNRLLIEKNQKDVAKLSKERAELKKVDKDSRDTARIAEIKTEIAELKIKNDIISEKQSEYRQAKKDTKKALTEDNQERYIKRKLYADNVISNRKKLFGENYVNKELKGEYVSFRDLDPNSELSKDKELFRIVKERKELFDNIKNTFISRASEVMGERQANYIANALNKFENYYKNVVLDVNKAMDNLRNGVPLTEGLRNRAIGEYIERKGTTKSIDNNILYIDTIALGQMQQQIYQLDFIETIKTYDIQPQMLENWRNNVTQKLEGLKQRLATQTTTDEDTKTLEALTAITTRIANLLKQDNNLDAELSMIIQDIDNQNLFAFVNGQEMNIFDRVDYVLNNSMEYYQNELINNVDVASMYMFYHTNPQHKEVIDWLQNQNKEAPSKAKIKTFLRDYSATDFDGSHTAGVMYKYMNIADGYKKSLLNVMNEKIENYLPTDMDKDFMIVDNMGNPITYYGEQKYKGNVINIGGLLDVQMSNPEQMSMSVFNQFMIALDGENYIDGLIKDSQVMILPKDIGEGIVESLQKPNDTGRVTRTFNKWLRPLMILSPERVMKFNINTAFFSDVYRMAQTNPKAVRNVGKAINMISEYFRTGEVKNRLNYDNVGVHLGTDRYNTFKAEPAHKMKGRSTGHFGTGTYFLNNKDNNVRIDENTHYVNFDDYNLYKPSDSSEASALHSVLKLMNDLTGLNPALARRMFGTSSNTEIDFDEFFDVDYNANDYSNNFIEDISKFVEENPQYKPIMDTLSDVINEIEPSFENINEFENTLEELEGEGNAEYKVYKSDKGIYYLRDSEGDYYRVEKRAGNQFEAYSVIDGDEDVPMTLQNDEISSALMNSRHDIENAGTYVQNLVKRTMNEMENIKRIKQKTTKAEFESFKKAVVNHDPTTGEVNDSISTLYMKDKGYEGIDVRHISDFDNFTYGSVIYDVKEESKLNNEVHSRAFNRQKIFYEFQKLFGGQFDREMEVIQQKIAPAKWDKLIRQVEGIESQRMNPKKKAQHMIKAYIDVVGKATNFREMILRLSYGLETANELDAGKPVTYGAASKSQTKQLLDAGEDYKFISSVANQNFIAYKEAGNLARRMNRAWFPFFLFPEGNIKWHYRLYQNYIGDIISKDSTYSQRLKSTGKVGISLSIQLGLAQAIWNLMQRGMFGAPEEDEVPEYLKGKDMPFHDWIKSATGLTPNNYIQLGPVTLNKFNLAQDVMNFVPENKGTFGDTVHGYFNTWMGRVSPLLKAPYEWSQGGDLYSDGMMYPVNDKYNKQDNAMRKMAGMLGMSKTFEYWFDASGDYPNAYRSSDDNIFQDTMNYGKMMMQYQGTMITTNERNAYQQTKNNFYNYMDEVLGKPYEPSLGYSSEKDQIKNAIKLGLKNVDEEYTDKMIREYARYLVNTEEKTPEQAFAQIKALLRGQSFLYMGNISKEDRMQFVRSLSIQEYELFKKAIDYERQMFGKYAGVVYN